MYEIFFDHIRGVTKHGSYLKRRGVVLTDTSEDLYVLRKFVSRLEFLVGKVGYK